MLEQRLFSSVCGMHIPVKTVLYCSALCFLGSHMWRCVHEAL